MVEENDYFRELEEIEAERDAEEYEEYLDAKFLKAWKDDVVNSLAKFDAETVEEVYQKGLNSGFDEGVRKTFEAVKSMIKNGISMDNVELWIRDKEQKND